MLGVAKLHRLDADAADYLEIYIKNFKGRNYIKEAYQKLAWSYLANGNLTGYTLNMANVLKYGKDQLDEDKTAQKEAKVVFRHIHYCCSHDFYSMVDIWSGHINY